MAPAARTIVQAIIRRLAEHLGPPPAPFPVDPFELILWEQVGYLAADPKRRAAFEALREWGGDLRRVLALPLAEARTALAAFPMIGEPGADKILAWNDATTLVPLDSNALRVATRLGFVSEAKDYRAWYRAARDGARRRAQADACPPDFSRLISARSCCVNTHDAQPMKKAGTALELRITNCCVASIPPVGTTRAAKARRA